MRFLFLVFSLFCLLLSSCFFGSSILFLESDTENRPNLLDNPGFESEDKRNPGMPEGWLVVSSSSEKVESVVLDSSVVFTGINSLKIQNPDRDLYLVSDAFKVNFTGGFFTKCAVRAEKQMQKPLRVYFWAYNASGNKENSFRKSIKAKPDWKKATISEIGRAHV